MILAIDPGPEESTYIFYNQGVVLNHETFDNEDLFRWLGRYETLFTDLVAIEMVACYGMAVGKEVFETCLAIGRILEIVKREKTALVYRRAIKLHLCGSPRAKDANIRQALIDRLGRPGTKRNPGVTYGISGHAWQALAIAVYAEDVLLQKEPIA